MRAGFPLRLNSFSLVCAQESTTQKTYPRKSTHDLNHNILPRLLVDRLENRGKPSLTFGAFNLEPLADGFRHPVHLVAMSELNDLLTLLTRVVADAHLRRRLRR